jgi:hypothetical protein
MLGVADCCGKTVVGGMYGVWRVAGCGVV